MFGCTSKSITALKTEWNEEKSYSFLNFFITYQDWCTYSTKKLSHSEVLVLSDLFCLSHGKVAPKQGSELSFWSVHPMNIFRFKLLDNLNFDVLNYPDPSYNKPGYIVEGCYWVNGFMYQVLEEDSKINPFSLSTSLTTSLIIFLMSEDSTTFCFCDCGGGCVFFVPINLEAFSTNSSDRTLFDGDIGLIGVMGFSIINFFISSGNLEFKILSVVGASLLILIGLDSDKNS